MLIHPACISVQLFRSLVVATWMVMGGICSFAAEKAAPAEPGAVQFSRPGGIFTNDLSIRLSTSTAGAVIRYTIDGSDPTAASSKYNGPVQISESTVIKAAVFDGKTAGTISGENYIMADPEVATFNSNLPLVVITTFGQQIPNGQKVTASIRFIGKENGRSALLGPADFDGRADVNVRGHTSLRYPKHSYHVKTKDAAHQPKKTELFGLPKESDWVLYAPYPDKTLMRDVLVYDLSNAIGRYASRTEYVEVFVNSTGRKLSSRDYVGLYVLLEKVKRGKNRVDIQKLAADAADEPDISGGYIFKKDHLDSVELGMPNQNSAPAGFPSSRGAVTGPGAFPANPEGFLPVESGWGQGGFYSAGNRSSASRGGFVTGRGGTFLFVDPKPTEITPRQRSWLARHLNEFERVLYGTNFANPKTGYAAYIDPDSFIDHHLLVESTKNIDGFRFSTFYYKDRGDRIKMGPIWDWNLSLGNANGKQGWIPEYWYWPQLDDHQYSWFRRLFEDPDFAQKYVDRWGELRGTHFSTPNLMGRIDRLAAHLEEAQTRNFRRWRILGRSVWPNSYVGQSYADEVAWMKRWFSTRLLWIDRQFSAVPTCSSGNGPIAKGKTVTLQSPSGGKIFYTLDGSDPRLPGGATSPKARAYTAPITINENASLVIRGREGSHWSYPVKRKLTVTSGG